VGWTRSWSWTKRKKGKIYEAGKSRENARDRKRMQERKRQNVRRRTRKEFELHIYWNGIKRERRRVTSSLTPWLIWGFHTARKKGDARTNERGDDV